MKRPVIWTLALLAVCAAFTLSAPEGRAAVVTVTEIGGLQDAVRSASDGDTIVLNVGCVIPASSDNPWVIDKAVTIQGGSITCGMGGILLTKDVTFQDIEIGFGSYVRDSIMANGHTLTLRNVTCSSGARPLNLFCGGAYTGEGASGYYGSPPGGGGRIILSETVSLASREGLGNIYAGNLCLGGMAEGTSGIHGPANTFEGSPEIIIEAEQGSELGNIYAGGAEQKIPEGNISGKVFLTNPAAYQVSGTVSVQLHASTAAYVNGLGAGGTDVIYTDTRDHTYVTNTLGLYQIDSLTVESGHVSPLGDSSFVSGASLTVRPGAKLGLEQLGNVSVGRFSGGGKLCLGENQLLTVTGAVSGETSVVIGGFAFDDTSSGTPVAGKVYIQAPASSPDSFTLAPPNARPGMTFILSGSGEWCAADNTAETSVVARSLRFENGQTLLPSGGYYAELPLIAELVNEEDTVDYLPVEIFVDGTAVTEDSLCEMKGVTVSVYIAEGALCIKTEEITAVIPDGTYKIDLTVPGSNTASGRPITASATLVVGDSPEGLQELELSGGVVRIHLAGPMDAGTPATVLAAVYDAGGKMLRCGSAPVPAGGAVSVDVPLSTDGGWSVRAFLTDGQNPLCPSLSKTLS